MGKFEPPRNRYWGSQVPIVVASAATAVLKFIADAREQFLRRLPCQLRSGIGFAVLTVHALRDSWTRAVELLAETFALQYRSVTTEVVAFLRGQRVHGHSFAGADKDCVEGQLATVAAPVRQ
jgi:hypothetical protein